MAQQVKPRSRPGLILGLLLIVCVSPVVIAWLLTTPRLNWRPTELAHSGELMAPPIELADLLYAQGPDKERLSGKWNLSTFAEGSCGETCLQTLTKMRHLQLALGRNVIRTQRVLIHGGIEVLDASSPSFTDYPAPVILNIKESIYQCLTARLAEQGVDLVGDGSSIYVLDPRGFMMMRYTNSAPFGAVVDDLKRLLKASTR